MEEQNLRGKIRVKKFARPPNKPCGVGGVPKNKSAHATHTHGLSDWFKKALQINNYMQVHVTLLAKENQIGKNQVLRVHNKLQIILSKTVTLLTKLQENIKNEVLLFNGENEFIDNLYWKDNQIQEHSTNGVLNLSYNSCLQANNEIQEVIQTSLNSNLQENQNISLQGNSLNNPPLLQEVDDITLHKQSQNLQKRQVPSGFLQRSQPIPHFQVLNSSNKNKENVNLSLREIETEKQASIIQQHQNQGQNIDWNIQRQRQESQNTTSLESNQNIFIYPFFQGNQCNFLNAKYPNTNWQSLQVQENLQEAIQNQNPMQQENGNGNEILLQRMQGNQNSLLRNTNISLQESQSQINSLQRNQIPLTQSMQMQNVPSRGYQAPPVIYRYRPYSFQEAGGGISFQPNQYFPSSYIQANHNEQANLQQYQSNSLPSFLNTFRTSNSVEIQQQPQISNNRISNESMTLQSNNPFVGLSTNNAGLNSKYAAWNMPSSASSSLATNFHMNNVQRKSQKTQLILSHKKSPQKKMNLIRKDKIILEPEEFKIKLKELVERNSKYVLYGVPTQHLQQMLSVCVSIPKNFLQHKKPTSSRKTQTQNHQNSRLQTSTKRY